MNTYVYRSLYLYLSLNWKHSLWLNVLEEVDSLVLEKHWVEIFFRFLISKHFLSTLTTFLSSRQNKSINTYTHSLTHSQKMYIRLCSILFHGFISRRWRRRRFLFRARLYARLSIFIFVTKRFFLHANYLSLSHTHLFCGVVCFLWV